MIASHTEFLAGTAEGVRRELLPIAILKSNYCKEARKYNDKLKEMIAFITIISNSDETTI